MILLLLTQFSCNGYNLSCDLRENNGHKYSAFICLVKIYLKEFHLQLLPNTKMSFFTAYFHSQSLANVNLIKAIVHNRHSKRTLCKSDDSETASSVLDFVVFRKQNRIQYFVCSFQESLTHYFLLQRFLPCQVFIGIRVLIRNSFP